MCARRFLLVVFILILLAVVGAFAIYQWGGEILLRQAVPKGHFEAAEAGGGPDYARLDAWIAHPDLPDDPSRWQPEGVPAPDLRQTAQTFYIHPTTYLERDRWNGPLHLGGQVGTRTELFVQSQASAFQPVGSIWAPRYRQAAYGAFLLKSEDARQALALAYSDLSAALDRFLAETDERPVILAGHSQGALHLMRLLREHKARLSGRLVAAYVVGWPVDLQADLPSLGFPACRGPGQIGCILSWMSFAEPANPSLILGEWEKTDGPRGIEHERERILCVNPISGTQGGAAGPAANPGTLVPTADLRSAAITPGRVGARCEKGLLILDGDIPNLGAYVLPGNNYHVYDYALFWGAIRRDAERRVTSWRR
jgi:DUF3089 family protein